MCFKKVVETDREGLVSGESVLFGHWDINLIFSSIAVKGNTMLS